MKRIFVICVSTVFLISCQNSDSSSESVTYDSSIVTPSTISPANAPVTTDSTIQSIPQTGMNASPLTTPALQPQTINPSTISSAVPASTGAGLNPAHGQPGHRCEIAVGAPLNSAPAATSVTPAASAKTSSTTPSILSTPAVSATPAKTAPGMNPPHGEPGHRCDISVGAPLNSAPAKPATISTSTDASKQTPVVLPAASGTGDSAKP